MVHAGEQTPESVLLAKLYVTVMLSRLVAVSLRDERRGFDIIQLLDQRLNRPVHVLTATVDGLRDREQRVGLASTSRTFGR